MMSNKDFKGFNRFVAPLLAVAGSAFMVFAAIKAHSATIPGYLLIFVIVMLIGVAFIKKKDISGVNE